ncbi:hypothetical protein BS50DRAFT_98087 [Corynespora cassiicola Philippines]|uniref:Blue (type 1) copper domain-containing protein n=1 Tax=Corynespora cassiicola Philippines TaxID=1448308 RepID=A0A2T2NFA1_CORCC|nr:hypothetical protein BS50DRAFT_98087 [Corynespora cassiicola Philippines]
MLSRFFTLILLAATALAKVHVVTVGKTPLKFEPQLLRVDRGDTVVFEIFPKHNVVKGPFTRPCEPFGEESFFSGPFSETENGAKKFVVNVPSNDATYYYCAVNDHCQQGMVGGWNIPADGDNNIEAYAKAAKDVERSLSFEEIRGGQLLDDRQLASITGSASPNPTQSSRPNQSETVDEPPTTTESASSSSGTAPASEDSSSSTGTAVPPDKTGAADTLRACVAAAVIAVAALAA